jgi:hypothetical protein
MQLIIAFAVLGALLVVGGLLLRPVPPSTFRGEREGTAIVLRPPRGRYAILAAMAIGPTLLVLVVAAAAARRQGIGVAGLALVAAAVAVGVAVTAYFLLAERRMRVRVDGDGVERVDPLSTRRIAWLHVETIAYNGVSRWFFLTGPAGIRVWVPENLAGIGDFADEALARIRPEVLRADAATVDALRQIADEARERDRAGPAKPA